MTPELTREQAQATRPDANVWVSASAGTGKTFVLTARVLRLLLDGTAPERILCLTFTKAAASEMTTRVLKALGAWVGLDDKRLAVAIQKRTGAKPDKPMLDRARRLFAQVLETPGGLKIQTIHAFCQSLLGRFPVEAQLEPGFEVMDERSAAEALASARELALTPEAGLKDAAGRVATRVTEQGFGELMAGLAADRGLLRRLIARHGGSASLIRATRQALGLSDGVTRESVLDAALADSAMDGDGLKRLVGALATGTAAEQGRGAAIADFLAQPEDRQALLAGYRWIFLTQKNEPKKTVATGKTLQANPGLDDVIAAEQTRLRRLTDQLKSIEAAENTAALLALGGAVLRHYDHAKKQSGRVDYDDLIADAGALLAVPGVAAWVLYKLDGGIDHILVDEAQDTNPDQWRVIDAIAEEFFAGAGAREATRTVFAVGDRKQSIYRFQGADPDAFGAARSSTQGRAAAGGGAFRDVPLNLSFRSGPAVLGFVDHLFADAGARAGLAETETEIRHTARRLGQAGLVELWPLEPVQRPALPADWQAPVTQERGQSAETRLAQRIARRIARMIGEEERLESRDRPIRPGDILVLVRRRQGLSLIDDLVRELKQRGIAVAGADRLTLMDQLPVMDLAALAKFALLPDDDLTLATVLKSPLVGLTEDDLFELAYGRGEETLWRTLVRRAGERDEFADAHGFLSDVLARADYVTPYAFFAWVLTDRAGRRSLASRLGTEIDDPLDEFLNLALDYEARHTPSLQGFLHWFAAGDSEIKRDLEQGADQVRIMTIHGAKGLEAPIVFLPDTTALPQDRTALVRLPQRGGPPLIAWAGARANETGAMADARAARHAEDMAEYRRLLYVALTRAADRLYIAGWEGARRHSAQCWYALIERAFDTLEDVETAADGDVRRYAREQERKPEPDATLRDRISAAAPLPAWATRPPAPEPAPPRPLAPSRSAEADPPALGPTDEERRTALRRGTLIHRLFELLPDVPARARRDTARRFLARPAWRLSTAEQAEMEAQVFAVLDDARFAALFGPGSRAEVEVAGVVNGRVVAGRIDRLVVTDRDILIVDFKTDRLAPDGPVDIPRAYADQMAAYARLIAGVYPDKPVRAMLLWTASARLMEVPVPG